MHGMLGYGRLGLMDGLSGMNEAFLINAHCRFVLFSQFRSLLVEIEYGGSLLDEIRVGWLLPQVAAPRLDLVFPEPADDCTPGEGIAHSLFPDNLQQFSTGPPLPWFFVILGP